MHIKIKENHSFLTFSFGLFSESANQLKENMERIDRTGHLEQLRAILQLRCHIIILKKSLAGTFRKGSYKCILYCITSFC